jgi:hypothetical protein
VILVISIVVTVVMAGLLYRLFFKDFHDFIECMRFYFQPDIVSMFRGELLDDWWGSTKFVVWVVISLAMGAATLYKLPQLIPGLKHKAVATLTSVQKVASRTKNPASSQLENQEQISPTYTNQDSNISSNSVPATKTSAPPAGANRYGLKVGDTIEISAVNPAIALRKATVITMNSEQLIVRSGVDDYTVRWDDIIKVKSSAHRN